MKKLLFCLFLILGLSTFAHPITMDGQPHFDKMLNRKVDYVDTPDSFKITKKGNDYILVYYSYDPEEIGGTGKTTVKKQKLKVYKNVYLIDRSGIVYGYDTAKKKIAVFYNVNSLNNPMYED